MRKTNRPQASSRNPTDLSLAIRTVKVVLLLTTILGLSLVFFGSFLWPLTTNRILVIASDDLAAKQAPVLVYFSQDYFRVDVIQLPGDQKISVLGGYGEYELKNLSALGKIEKKDTAFLRSMYSFALKIPVSEVIITGRVGEISHKSDLMRVVGRNIPQIFDRQGGFFSRLSMLFFLRSLPSEKVVVHQEVDLSDLPELVSADGQECTVAIVNTSQVTGLASQVSVIVETLGVRVVRLADQAQVLEKSSFVFANDDEQCQKLANQLQVVFPSEVVKTHQSELLSEHRAGLVILLGRDLASQF